MDLNAAVIDLLNKKLRTLENQETEQPIKTQKEQTMNRKKPRA